MELKLARVEIDSKPKTVKMEKIFRKNRKRRWRQDVLF